MRILAGLLVAVACAAQEPDIRGVRWGMTERQVQAAEGRSPDAKPATSEWRYEVEVAGWPAVLEYVFTLGELHKAAYYFTHRQVVSQRFFEDYEALEKLLEEKYGEPGRLDVQWHDERFKESPDHWPQAVALGDLTWTTSWPTERTLVQLHLAGDGASITLSITYWDRAVSLEDVKKEVLKDL